MRSRPPIAAGLVLGVCALLLPLAVFTPLPAQTGSEERQKAEKLFQDVYGKEFDRLLKSSETAAKAAFVKKLTAAADEVAKDDAPLARLIKEKAADLAGSDAATYPQALELLNSLVPEAPVKVPFLEKIVGLHEKALRSARLPERVKVAEGLVSAYQELAAQQLFERQAEAAQKTLDRAKQVAGYYLKASPELTAELDRQLVVVSRELKVQARIQAAQKTLKDKPDDPTANTVLGLHTLLVENKPAHAAPLLARSDDAGVRKLGEAFNKNDPGDLETADAYRAAADAASAKEFKAPLQARALQYYKAVLEREPKHPEATRIKLVAAQLAEAVPATEPGAKPPAGASIYAKVGAAIRGNLMAETRSLGGGNDPFRDMLPQGALLAGFDISYGEFVGNATIKSIRPIFLTERGQVMGAYHGFPSNKPARVVAKQGYAVGAITIKAGAGIDGLSVTFMKIQENGLNPAESYTTEWLGGQGGGRPTMVGGDGSPVVGIFGRTGGTKPPRIDLNGLGLITVPKQ